MILVTFSNRFKGSPQIDSPHLQIDCTKLIQKRREKLTISSLNQLPFIFVFIFIIK